MSRQRILRAAYLLPVACVASAAVLGASEFMNTFALRPPGGETQQVLGAGSRHAYALLVLAGFAVIALAVTVLTGSKPAAVAVGLAGAAALLLFLIVDLPHVNQEGTPGSLFSSTPGPVIGDLKAYPASGFWLEMLGALALAVTGGALATLRPEQLADLPGGLAPQPESRKAKSPSRESEPTRSHTAAGGAARRRERELAARRAARRRRASD